MIERNKPTNKQTNKNPEREEEKGLMGSSAADSQLATARSQLRFQSAAFSSRLQTATQTILDKNNKTSGGKRKNKKGHFQSSDGIALKESVTGATLLCSPVVWLKKKKEGGGLSWGSAGPDNFNSTIVFQTALPTANTAPTRR